MQKKIYCIIGVSGSGKTDVIGRHLKSRGVLELVSHTTREMRKGEKDGVTYYYLNNIEEFNKLEKVEKAYYDKGWYCLSKKEIESKLSGNDKVFVIMEKRGIKQLLNNKEYKDMTEVIYVYSTASECAERMLKSKRDYKKIIDRLVNAIEYHEFSNMDISDHIIRNKQGEIDKTLKKLDFIIDNF